MDWAGRHKMRGGTAGKKHVKSAINDVVQCIFYDLNIRNLAYNEYLFCRGDYSTFCYICFVCEYPHAKKCAILLKYPLGSPA